MTVSGAGSSTSQTRIAGGTDGASWVVWKRNVGGFDVIEGTKVQPDGTQGPIVTLSVPVMQASDPVVASRADGSARVAWLNLSATDDTVHSRSIAADGTLGEVQTLSTVGPVGQPAANIDVALGDDGTAGVAWRKFNGTNWVIQAVKVAADGTPGVIHDLSDPATSAGIPDIAAAPPLAAVGANSYRAAWPQGTGDTANVFSREIVSDDTVGEIYQALWPRVAVNPTDPTGPGTGGNPVDVHIGYGSDKAMNIMWVRTREDVDPETSTSYFNRAVEWIRGTNGATPTNTAPAVVNTVTPTVVGETYNVSALDMDVPFGSQPVMSWVHDIGLAQQQVVTGRLLRSGAFTGWANGTGVEASLVDPVIAANASTMGVAGWTVPGLLPGQDKVAWNRFSNETLEPFTPTGDFVYSDDLGFEMANSGVTMAAFTAIDGGSIGTSRIMTYTNPGLAVDPGAHNFGSVDVGLPSTRYITIRSTGQTPNTISAITVSGANASQFQLVDASTCQREMTPGSACRFGIRFTPGSTGTKTASVKVQSTAGDRETSLTGRGANRTRNRLTATPKKAAARRGRVVKIRVKATNTGGVASTSTRVCGNLNRRALRLAGNRCRTIGSLAAGTTRTLTYRVRVTGRARTGVRFPVIFRMRSGNAVVRQAVVNIRRKGR